MGGIEGASFRLGYGAGLMTVGVIAFFAILLSSFPIASAVISMILGGVWMAWGAYGL